MRNPGTVQQIIQALRQKFGNKLMSIYIFGSWGAECETKQSDIDIAILWKSKTPQLVLWSIAQEMAAQFKRDVDLLDLRKSSIVMQMQVISTGERLPL